MHPNIDTQMERKQNLAIRHALVTLDTADAHVSNTAGLARRVRASPSIQVGLYCSPFLPKMKRRNRKNTSSPFAEEIGNTTKSERQNPPAKEYR